MITIAVGVGENKNIVKACKLFNNKYGDAEIKPVYNDDELVESILNNDIDSTVRGSLKASEVMKTLKKHYQNISRATYVHSDEYEFLLTPVGIDEGNTVDEKLNIAVNCAEFLEKLNKTPKIAVLANGREGDWGRSSEISKSIDESKQLTEFIEKETDYNVKNYFILVEKAIKEKCNIIIAPNGIIGNIIFRTLVMLDSWPSYGAVTFGVNSIYIDTSRDQSVDGYLRSLILAYDLAKL